MLGTGLWLKAPQQWILENETPDNPLPCSMMWMPRASKPVFKHMWTKRIKLCETGVKTSVPTCVSPCVSKRVLSHVVKQVLEQIRLQMFLIW